MIYKNILVLDTTIKKPFVLCAFTRFYQVKKLDSVKKSNTNYFTPIFNGLGSLLFEAIFKAGRKIIKHKSKFTYKR